MLFNYLKAFMTLDHWNTSILAFTFLMLGIALVGIPAFRYGSALWKQNVIFKEQELFFQGVLDFEACCWWTSSHPHLRTSREFIGLLGLNEDLPVYLRDVINQFRSQDAHELTAQIQALEYSFAPFESIFNLIDDQTLIKVIGCYLPIKNNSYFVLHLLDVTQENTEKDHLKTALTKAMRDCKWYEQLTNSIPMVLWGRDDSLKLSYCNQVYAGILDSDSSKVILEGRELVEPQRHNSPYQLAQKAFSSNLAQSVRMHIVVDGHRRLIEATEVPLDNLSGTIGYGVDLTDLEEVVSTLSKHVASHQQVLHNLSTPIAVYGADTRLEFFNTAYLKLLGFEEKWLYQKPLYVEVLQDLRERRKLPEYLDFTVFKQTQLQLFNTLIEPLQELINQPDGKILRMMVVPQPLGGLLFMFDDVTDKIAMERRYNTLIAVQKETIDHLYEGIVVLGSDNRLRLSNPAAARLWKVNNIELLPGRHAGEILYQIRHMFKGFAEWDEFRQKILSLFNMRQPVTDSAPLKDNTMLQYSYVPLPDGSHLLSFIDLSDRWRFEQALRERNEALEQADRFKSDFISHVSYELRAPLNTIIGFSEILLNQYFGDLNERQVDYAQGITDSSQRLLNLINDIIDLASVEAGQLSLKMEPVDLENFLSSLTRFVFNRSNDHGLQINYSNNTKVKFFLGDERRLKQVLFNLLMNAIKFTPAGGRISLTATVEEKEDERYLCFCVHDTGIGINEEKRQEIYKLFETKQLGAVSKSKVTGIGLHLVKSFIELHSGYIFIKSAPEEGTSVFCYIPLREVDDGKVESSEEIITHAFSPEKNVEERMSINS